MSESWGPWIDATQDLIIIQVGHIAQSRMKTEKGDILGPPKLVTAEMIWALSECAMIVRTLTNMGDDAFIRYRIRKPKGLSILQDILREVEDDGGMGYNEREMEEVK